MSILKNLLIILFISILQNSFGTEKDSINSLYPKVKTNILDHPIVIGKLDTDVLNFELHSKNNSILTKIELVLDTDYSLNNIALINLIYRGKDENSPRRTCVGSSQIITHKVEVRTNRILNGTDYFSISFSPSPNASVYDKIKLKSIIFSFSSKKSVKVDFPESESIIRFAYLLRASGENNCHTYRIPGLVTTNKGTLIAVYDNRYNSSTDLQGNIDIGMSRSIDGGKSWSNMKVIMDMGEWGGKTQSENGIGDPSILVDTKTNNIWVAGLWLFGHPGQMAWNASNTGLSPEETGQLMIVKSDDDGLTWSDPINITKHIKKPEWSLMFQGPGRGITSSDGTLIIPGQFRDDKKVPHSTIFYSHDQGTTWQIGTGAKPNTTEAQVVQLHDGSLMLNMRDDRNRTEKGENNGRAVATTNDLGSTWLLHPTSNKALPEPNCMASIIDTYIDHDNKLKHVLLFSNPNNKERRTNMTLKASLDEGLTWSLENQLEINCDEGYGYSCLTMIDDKNVGILYEGIKDLYFQIIPLKDIIREISF